MPLARTLTAKSQLVTWFTTVLVPEAQPDLRARFANYERSGLSFQRIPHRTPYLEDQAGALEKVIPSGDFDWVEKYAADSVTSDPDDIWDTEPTFDQEQNQLTPGVPTHGWITPPVTDANGQIVEPGVPDPNPKVQEFNWRQFWKNIGFTIPVDFPTTPITDGCPDPATGEWINSIYFYTTDDRRNSGVFRNEMRMRVRYTIDDPGGAAGNREWEVEEEYFWRDETSDNGATWVNSASSDWVETYRGPTAAPTAGP